MIALRSIHKSYDNAGHRVKALDGISLVVPTGVVCGVVGHRGSGKTALLRCISQLDRPDSGSVLVDQASMASLSGRALRAARRQIGFLSQRHGLLESATVFDNVSLPLRLAAMPRSMLEQRVKKVLDWAGLAEHERAYPQSLTSFQKSRVALARAAVQQPPVLLCDAVPATADRSDFIALLRSLQRTTGMTLIVVSRAMDLIESLCQRVAVLNHGQIIENGSVDDVVANPRQAITYDLVQWSAVQGRGRIAEAAVV